MSGWINGNHSAILRLGMAVVPPFFVASCDHFPSLYRGEERFLRDGILCLPCEDFLLPLRPGKEISP